VNMLFLIEVMCFHYTFGMILVHYAFLHERFNFCCISTIPRQVETLFANVIKCCT
jgi:hypothetical protein